MLPLSSFSSFSSSFSQKVPRFYFIAFHSLDFAGFTGAVSATDVVIAWSEQVGATFLDVDAFLVCYIEIRVLYILSKFVEVLVSCRGEWRPLSLDVGVVFDGLFDNKSSTLMG